MGKYNLSREEAIKSFEDRCRCESREPETEEEKRRADENFKKSEELFKKKYGNILNR